MADGTTPKLLQISLWGVPGLVLDGHRLHIGARKAIALVALLALDGEAPRDRLAQQLWPDLDATAARRNLRREVYRLREAGLALAESASGALGLPPSAAVDVAQFRQAAQRGDDEAALGLSQVSLLAGLDGVAGSGFDERLLQWRNQLTQERAVVRIRRAEALSASGQAGDQQAALALHRQAVAEDHFDETSALAAMRLLADMDEHAHALTLYVQLERALHDDLGIAPGAALQSLALELRGASKLPANPLPTLRTAAPLLAAKIPYFSRPALQAKIQAACLGCKRVYLSGAPGVGKTRLASECAAARGPWLMVACTPNDVELAFSSGVRVLRALREAAPDVLLPDWVRRELAQLMPEFGPAPQALATDEARARLVAAIAEAWRVSVTDNFQTVVLDDWHWCDAASVELWNDLVDDGVAWIVVHRSAALPQVALQRMRADVDAGLAVALQLTGLELDDVLAFIQQLSGSASGTLFAQRLHATTDGNPFFLIETLRHLFERNLLTQDTDGWSTPFDDQTQDSAELPVPKTVRDAVLARVRMLGSRAQRLLEAAALLHGPFSLLLILPTDATVSTDDVAALEHAQAASLIVEAADAYNFAHDLIRQCVADSLSPARKRLLHERLAQNLIAVAAPPALIAAQFEAAGRLQSAVPWRSAAAHHAMRLHALGDAQQQFDRALADGPAAREAVDIHLALAQLHRRRGDAVAIEAALSAAIQAAAQADVDTRLQAQLARAEYWCSKERFADGLALLDVLAGDLSRATPQLNARALSARADALVRQGDAMAARQLVGRAIAVLQGVPDATSQLAELLHSAALTAIRRGDLSSGAEFAKRAVAIFEAAGDIGREATLLAVLGVTVLHAERDPVRALALFQRSRVLAAQCGHVPAQRSAILNLIKIYADRGDIEPALKLLEEGEALAPGFEHTRAELAFLQVRYFLHYQQGDVPAARAAATRLLDVADRTGEPEAIIGSSHMVADLFFLIGDLEQAQAMLDKAQQAALAADKGGGHLYQTTLVAKRALLIWLQGDPTAAAELLRTAPEATRGEDRFVVAWVGAGIALALGDTASASQYLQGIEIQADMATDAVAQVLVQRLALARALGQSDDAARARAAELLSAGKVPALEAAKLRAALGE